MRTTLVLVVALVVAAGCGDDKPSISSTKDNVCDQIAAVACYDLYQCCSEGQIENYLMVNVSRTEEGCRSDIRRLCEQQVGQVDASIAAGRVRFDAKVMNACLDALLAPDGSCSGVDATLPWATACMMSAWVGTVADGGMCIYRYECASADSYCSAGQACTALPGNGAQCSPFGCATGFYCNGATCAALVGAGGMCNGNQQCADGLYCNRNGGGPGMCAARATAGQPCTNDQACASNQCLPGTCSGGVQTCFAAADCNGRCSNNNQGCQQDADCGNGACSIGGAQCQRTQDCGGGGGTCVFVNTCVRETCVGDVVCAGTQVNVDYCTGPITDLPLPP